MDGLQRFLTGAIWVTIALVAMTSCRKPKDAVKSDLSEAGYQITTPDWFRASRSNDVAALKKFIKGGFSATTTDADGDSALHAAAAAGAKDSAGFLLSSGLPVDLRGASDRTPLMAAVIGNQPLMVRWLLRRGSDPRLKDKDGFDPLMLAAHEGKPGAVAELAPYRREGLDSALLLAAMEGRTGVIDTLTNFGASVYARMEDGRSPLMVAAENGHTDTVKLLLDIGAGRFATDTGGHTAADLAKAAGHQDIAALISRNPLPEELTLETPAEVAKSMDQFVEAEASKSPDSADITDDPIASANSAETTAQAKHAARPSKSIQNEVLSASVPPATGSNKSSNPTSSATVGNGSFAAPPLVMRLYREREVPIEVRAVEGETATLEIRGTTPREVNVHIGKDIPGSRLLVVKVQHRMKSSKLNLGKPMDVSVVEVRDTATGITREWITGVSSGAHDPLALVEDATTGKRYTAAPGQRFKSADGAEFVVSDVRPNQIIIEEAATGAVQTIPLRGPRG